MGENQSVPACVEMAGLHNTCRLFHWESGKVVDIRCCRGRNLRPIPTSSSFLRTKSMAFRILPSGAVTSLSAACLTLFLAGCDGEQPIVEYTIPTEMPAALRQEDVRTVGVIVPQPQQAWFFKVKGPKSAVDRVAKTFETFVSRVTFEDGVPVIDSLPDGWRRGKDRPMRFASIDINTPEKQLDLSISQLSRMTDWDELVAMNVNRWRKQVGLDESDERWAGAEPFERSGGTAETSTETAVWVDVEGRPDEDASPMVPGRPPFAASGSTAPPFLQSASSDGPSTAGTAASGDPHAGLPRSAQEAVAKARAERRDSAASATSERSSPLEYDRPEGWRDGRQSAMRLASFDVGPTAAAAEVTVIVAGGDLRDNVARWIGQVLEGAPDDAVVDRAMKNAESLTVSERDAQRFLLYPDELGNEKQPTAIDAVIVPLENQSSLFVKMTGPVETVRQQADELSTFLRSLRLNR